MAVSDLKTHVWGGVRALEHVDVDVKQLLALADPPNSPGGKGRQIKNVNREDLEHLDRELIPDARA